MPVCGKCDTVIEFDEDGIPEDCECNDKEPKGTTMTQVAPETPHDHILDPGIRRFVEAFQREGIYTYESCEAGEGHAFLEPTIRFHGSPSDGWKALAIALELGFPVDTLRRFWNIVDGEPVGPDWEMTFTRKDDEPPEDLETEPRI